MEVHRLYELAQYINQVMALNFVDTLWVSCEIAQCNISRGHCYLNLIEKDEQTEAIKAQMSGVIWFRDFSFIKKKLGRIADQVLQDGMEVKLKVQVEYNERYGLKLVVKDIDPSYTYGQLAIQREKIIERLQQEGRMDINASQIFPTVVQRSAVISSHTAAGYQDFVEQLNNNVYGYAYSCRLFPAAMQGNRTEMEVVSAMKDIAEQHEQFDVVIITRGGGSKLDLSAFDSYGIAKTISEMPLPVITGIGHDIDLSIADMVSAIQVKTPTAVANYLIDHNANFENRILDQATQIKQLVQHKFETLRLQLAQIPVQNQQYLTHRMENYHRHLDELKVQIPQGLKQHCNQINKNLDHIETIIQLQDPINILKKGYSLTLRDGKAIQSITELSQGDRITTRLQDGDIESTVN